jgi:hypothetical protein
MASWLVHKNVGGVPCPFLDAHPGYLLGSSERRFVSSKEPKLEV